MTMTIESNEVSIGTVLLESLLLEFQGAGFIGLVTSTEPKMNKKNRETGEANPFLNCMVRRIAHRNGIIGASYENAVNNQRKREEHPEAGEFRAESLWNGKGRHIGSSKILVEHTDSGKRYLVFYPSRTQAILNDVWYVDNQETELNDLKPYLPPVSKSTRQETDKEITWRVIALDSIISLSLNGKTYKVKR